jgi:hypothetical protein
MKDKILFTSIAFLFLISGIFSSCEKVKEFNDVQVTAVKELYEPAKDKYVVLQSTANLFFEWGKAYAEDNSIVFYELVFDKKEGDFSKPVYVIESDAKGLNTSASVTQKILNRIATIAGAATGEAITVKWAVRSNRGLNFVLSEESRELTLVRLLGIDELQAGEKLYITGEGSEDGQEVKAIQEGSSIAYEIYTKLEADKPYYFCSRINENERTFSVKADGTSFEETTGATPLDAKVSETGTYRIKLEFETAKISIEKIDKIEHLVPFNGTVNELSYVGKGVWKIQSMNFVFPSTGWSWDPYDSRYKFIFTVNGMPEHWGYSGTSDSRPDISDKGYRKLVKLNGTGTWDGPLFKIADQLFDVQNPARYYADVVVSMTAAGDYTHDFENIHE